MGMFELFLFIWIGMGLVKSLILLATFVVGVIEYGNPEKNNIQFFRNFIFGALVAIVISALFWPLFLISEGIKYFYFPDEYFKEITEKLFSERANERNG